MADCTGLENQQHRKVFAGSNPAPSASAFLVSSAPKRDRGEVMPDEAPEPTRDAIDALPGPVLLEFGASW